MKHFTVAMVWLALLLGGCTFSPQNVLRTLAGVLSAEGASSGPLQGQVAALPTPDPATPTPAPSQLILPTLAPVPEGPLAALTAVAGMIPTMDLDATPYAVPYRGVPIFIEFQARW
ncbi:MAG: hypothetical protein JXN59_09570 [Anaerolineae bacterium]|nr:hypothetical protein [Anaerolineae bacterium]